jgi:carboxyl-terminal processing protease
MADKQTGYIRLSRFAATTNEEFETALDKLRKEGMKNLILDLQSNGGGYLNVACMLADQFLDKDKLIVYTQGDKARRQDALATEKGLFPTGKLVILVDEYSASASEIVAGAVQDWDRGVIIGRRTFGKGLVQRAIELPDSSLIRLTIARYYTPSGRNIQKPYEKGNSKEYYKDFDNRYNKGEMLSADSIHFPDSLKYQTLVSKRTVYGGGGIMPDVFIPLDSTRSTDYHRKLINSGIMNRFTINYVNSNRALLHSKYPNIKKFIEKFSVDETIIHELTTTATEAKIEYDEKGFEKSKPLISLQIKALIANDLFEKNEYYQVINEINDSYQAALKIINDVPLYQSFINNQQ